MAPHPPSSAPPPARPLPPAPPAPRSSGGATRRPPLSAAPPRRPSSPERGSTPEAEAAAIASFYGGVVSARVAGRVFAAWRSAAAAAARRVAGLLALSERLRWSLARRALAAWRGAAGAASRRAVAKAGLAGAHHAQQRLRRALAAWRRAALLRRAARQLRALRRVRLVARALRGWKAVADERAAALFIACTAAVPHSRRVLARALRLWRRRAAIMRAAFDMMHDRWERTAIACVAAWRAAAWSARAKLWDAARSHRTRTLRAAFVAWRTEAPAVAAAKRARRAAHQAALTQHFVRRCVGLARDVLAAWLRAAYGALPHQLRAEAGMAAWCCRASMCSWRAWTIARRCASAALPSQPPTVCVCANACAPPPFSRRLLTTPAPPPLPCAPTAADL